MHWLLVPAGYCLGSISFGLLLVARLRGIDLRETGSRNPGATNALRSAGRLPALAVLLLDAAKGALPILIGHRIGAAGTILGATAVATVLGHMYPVFHGWRGGKGVATALGALGASQPTVLLLTLVVFVGVLAATRYVSLASIAAMATYPLIAWWLLATDRLAPTSDWVPFAAGMIAVAVIWRHRSNISRLLAGRERRLGDRGGSA